MDGVEFDVHVRRGDGDADIRRGEIRIDYFFTSVSKNTYFVLPPSQCTVFKVVTINIIIGGTVASG